MPNGSDEHQPPAELAYQEFIRRKKAHVYKPVYDWLRAMGLTLLLCVTVEVAYHVVTPIFLGHYTYSRVLPRPLHFSWFWLIAFLICVPFVAAKMGCRGERFFQAFVGLGILSFIALPIRFSPYLIPERYVSCWTRSSFVQNCDAETDPCNIPLYYVFWQTAVSDGFYPKIGHSYYRSSPVRRFFTIGPATILESMIVAIMRYMPFMLVLFGLIQVGHVWFGTDGLCSDESTGETRPGRPFHL